MAELLIEGSLLKNVVAAIEGFANDVTFDFSPAGLSLQAFSDDQLALVSLLLGAELFDRYRCDGSVSVGFSLARLSHVLGIVDGGYDVAIKAGGGAELATLLLENRIHPGEIAELVMPLVDVQSERPGIPEHDYHAVVRMPSTILSRICSHLSHNLGLHNVVISVTKEGIVFCNEQGAVVDRAEEATIIEMSKPLVQTFDLPYLMSFTKATPLSKVVTIGMSPGIPAMVEYKIREMGYIRFYIPPLHEV